MSPPQPGLGPGPGPDGPLPPVLTVTNVRHAFGARQALAGVSLEVRPGEVYALLGPNGAGKTTLVRAICGRLRPDGGDVRVVGRDPFRDGQARAALGLAPQALALYSQLTVAENLQTFASLAGLRGGAARAAVETAMTLTHTSDRARELVRRLSGGYQRRVNIAAAILAGPQLLVLDEPTVGVDLAARDAISEALVSLKGRGVAILLVTHDLEQAERLADRAGFLSAGEKVLEGSPAALIADAFGDRLEVEVEVVDNAPADLLAAQGLSPGASAGLWACLVPDGYRFAGELAERLTAAGVEVLQVRVRRPSLADLFAKIAGVEAVRELAA